VARILGPQECLLVGGLAVGSHGYVRATRDVDFVVRADLAAVRARLLANGIAAVLTRGDFLEGDFPCVRAIVDDVRIDLMPALVPLAWERAITVPLSKTTSLRVVDLEDLLRLKLKAGGPKDLMDVAALVLRHPPLEPSVRKLALAFGLSDALARWLADPRLRAEVRRTKGERALKRLAGRMRRSMHAGRSR
jgi:hypothetical protein